MINKRIFYKLAFIISMLCTAFLLATQFKSTAIVFSAINWVVPSKLTTCLSVHHYDVRHNGYSIYLYKVNKDNPNYEEELNRVITKIPFGIGYRLEDENYTYFTVHPQSKDPDFPTRELEFGFHRIDSFEFCDMVKNSITYKRL